MVLDTLSTRLLTILSSMFVIMVNDTVVTDIREHQWILSLGLPLYHQPVGKLQLSGLFTTWFQEVPVHAHNLRLYTTVEYGRVPVRLNLKMGYCLFLDMMVQV